MIVVFITIRHKKDPDTGIVDEARSTVDQQYSEQSTLRIGESLPKSEDSLSSQQGQRRRRHSGSIPDATTAISMMGGNDTCLTPGPDRLTYQVNEKKSHSATANHRHRSLSDSRSTNPRIGARGMLETAFDDISHLGNIILSIY